MPLEIATIAADGLQNLIRTLDHIAYNLVLKARGGERPDWKVYYPISGSSADYPATRNRNIKGVPRVVIDAIDATEPYKGGKGHALWQLNELNKADKHRLLISADIYSMGVDVVPAEFRTKFPIQVFIREVGPYVPPKVGDRLYSEPIEHEIDANRRFPFAVSFKDPGGDRCEPAINTLQDLRDLLV